MITPEQQLHITRARTIKHKVTPVINNWGLQKPKGGTGFWTSTYKYGSSSWIEWCKCEMPHWVEGVNLFVLDVNPKANVFIIDSLSDLNKLIRKYMRSPVNGCRQPKGIDFERLSLDYDGLHLTDEGAYDTRYHSRTAITDLNGWDCESTVWFRWCFDRVEKIKNVSNQNL